MSERDEPDFAAEGLLGGLDGREREARIALLRRLHGSSVSVEELRRAVAADRLALLPTELVLNRELRYTLAEALERSGVSEDFVARNRLALGLPRLQLSDREFGERDIEQLRTVKQMIDAGIPEAEVLELARISGRAAAQLADALVEIVGDAFLKPGDTEEDLGLRLGELAANLTPLIAPLMERPLRLHLRERIRREVIGRIERKTGRLYGGQPLAACFADMVGFTRLGEQSDAEHVGRVVRKLGELAGTVAEPPVRLVKLIGDAAMLVSRDPRPLVEAALTLVAAWRAEGPQLPPLRAGIATGEAVNSSGDWYGRPVNLASRITAVAPPDTVVATDAVRGAIADGYAWRSLGTTDLKGIEGEVMLLAVERTSDDAHARRS
jgi:adenylate cyclase